MELFYKSFIENVISFSFICWFNNLSVKNRNKLENIVKLSSKIINSQQRSLGQFCSNQVNKKALKIIDDKNHILNNRFELMQSGRRYRLPICKTNRYRLSFIPHAIKVVNASREGKSK